MAGQQDKPRLNEEDVIELQAQSTEVTEAVSTYTSNSSRPSRLKALDAAKKLVRELETGEDAWFSRIEGLTSAQVLRWIMHLGVITKMPITGSISATDLAAAIKAESSFLARFMRPLCGAGVFEETAPDVYAHTKESLQLLDENYTAYYELIVDEMFQRTLMRYPEYYSTRPHEDPRDPRYNPFAWANDMDGSLWFEVLNKDPILYAKFVKGMKGKWGAWPTTELYPFDTELEVLSRTAVEEDGVFIVDVGGSHGFTMKEIRETFPDLKGKIVVQDIPSVIESIPPDVLTLYKDLDIEPEIHDFWMEQPVKEAKVYWLRRIMHDWPDAQCQTILKHIADAMAPDSKVLIMDLLIPESVQVEETYCYLLDLMMMMFAGKERNEAEWRRLFDASGLEFVRLWKADVGQQAVIEARKKRG